MSAPTPYHLLRSALRQDGARPLITFYDDTTGERVELSVTTFDNWVAKTASLLTEGLDLEAGDQVALSLPAHWQTLVWASACWAVGLEVVLPEDAVAVDAAVADAALIVSGPDALPAAVAAAQATGAEVMACSLRPLGGRFLEPLPAGVLDYAVEVPGHPDQLLFPPVADPDVAALTVAGVSTLAGGLVERGRQRAAALGLPAGARLLVATEQPAHALLDALLAPLAVGGSAVLVRHADPDAAPHRLKQEQVTHHSGAALPGAS